MSFKLTINKISYKINNKILFYTQNNILISKQQIWGIIAPNGRGKSHLLHVLAGLKKPYQGEIFYNHQNIYKINDKDRSHYLGILLQQEEYSHLYISVENYLNLSFFNQQLNEDQQIEKLNKICEIFCLDSLRKTKVNMLSGGEFQRVRIAQLALRNPKIYLLDEPLNAIDPAMQKIILNYFKSEVENYEKSIIMVMHDILTASKISNYILTIQENGLIEFDSAEKMLSQEHLESIFNTSFQEILINKKYYYINF